MKIRTGYVASLVILGIFATAAITLTAPSYGQGDPEVVASIIKEGKENSHVWDYLTYISEEIGARLTGSTNLAIANAWTRDEFKRLGLHNARLQKIGELSVRFDRGACYAKMVEPAELDFEISSRAWSAGTNGVVRGPVFKIPATMEELDKIKDKLDGAWLLSKPQDWRSRRGRRGRRNADAEGETPDPAQVLRDQINELINAANLAGRITGSSSEIVNTGGERNWRDMDFNNLPTEVSMTVRRSDYDAMNSRLADGENVVIEVDHEHNFVEGPFGLYNVIAEIPGTEWPEQVVIVSGHLDSWDGPGSQGTQDDGTGVSVALEVARILTTLEVQPRRTIRFILYAAEEQGLIGSRGYVESLSEEELAGISAVFVEDGGTNYEGGLDCIASMAPMLKQATAAVNKAFPDMPVEINIREEMPRGGGSDHASFNSVGVPGFFWDEIGVGGAEGKDYRWIWHTQNDRLRYAIKEYMVQSAVCSAVTVYNLAMADTLLPRQPMEKEEAAEVTANANAVAPPPPAAPEAAVAAEVPSPAAAAVVLDAGAAVTVTGTWNAVMIEDGEPAGNGFTLIFETGADGKLKGEIKSGYGDEKINDAIYNAETGKLKFTMGGRAKVDIDVKGDEMVGKFIFSEEFTMSFKASREVVKGG